MNDKMMKLMEMKSKDKKSGMDDTEKDAKMSVLEHVRQMAQDMMKDKLGEMKKVTVAADSKDGLEHGLDKAKAMMGGHSADDMDDDQDPAQDADDSSDEDESEGDDAMPDHEEETGQGTAGDDQDSQHGDMSEEELDEKLAHLMAMKKKMTSKKS